MNNLFVFRFDGLIMRVYGTRDPSFSSPSARSCISGRFESWRRVTMYGLDRQRVCELKRQARRKGKVFPQILDAPRHRTLCLFGSHYLLRMSPVDTTSNSVDSGHFCWRYAIGYQRRLYPAQSSVPELNPFLCQKSFSITLLRYRQP